MVLRVPFLSSPNMLHIPPGAAGLDNGNIKTWTYLAMAWYHTQLILDNSEYEQNGSSPIDWGYVYWLVADPSRLVSPAGRNVWTGMRSSARAAISNQYVEGWLTEVQ
jgi:hypothetical protein